MSEGIKRPAVVIPVYNHGSRIGGVLERAASLGLPLVVVNDGSTDGTGALLRAWPDIVLREHPLNMGKGAALLTGFAAARELGCDGALTLDGDGQHDPLDGLELLAAGRGKRCLVVGRRRGMAGEHVPWTSRFGRGFSNFWVHVSGGPLLGDSQSGFRLYPLPEIAGLPVRARRYQYEVEVLVEARRAGIECVEVEVSVVYQEERISHFRPFRDFLRNSATFSRLIFRRIFSALVP